ncbi:LLM class flavin-dependent oxidoreductase [Chryseolinea sp. T2]|uniref:LLM class flavin-dependent oxidoreductase n=1 Tax=Chryseolinea sp. T2 TaxID=3129255 RepID=UPI0030771311
MRLSLLDLSPVPPDGNRTKAIDQTIESAQHAERLGYTRIWVAEHHNTGALAGRAPEVLIPLIAAKTSKIRVGSGSVLLNHYSPYKVAENFATLNDMFPGRIDMGIGRANTGPISDIALQRNRTFRQDTEDSFEQLVELLNWFNHDFEPSHPFYKVRVHGSGAPPAIWLLGSSPWSALAAAQLGLRYAFAAFINPSSAYDIVSSYRDKFAASSKPTGALKPDVILSVSVYCSETTEDAIRLSAPVQIMIQRLQQRGDLNGLLPTEEEAIRQLGSSLQKGELTDPTAPPRMLTGTPEQIKLWLQQLAVGFGAAEIMIQCISPHHERRLRSLELVAQALLPKVA